MSDLLLRDAIYNRFKADTGSGGLSASSSPLITNVFDETYIPHGSALPYVTVACRDEVNETMEQFSYDGLVTVQIWVEKEKHGVSNYQPATVADNIKWRIVGNWPTAEPPGYGLHRWQPTITGWAGAFLIYEGSETFYSEQDINVVMRFKITLTRQ